MAAVIQTRSQTQWRWTEIPLDGDRAGWAGELVTADGDILAECLWDGDDLDTESDGCGVTSKGYALGLSYNNIAWETPDSHNIYAAAEWLWAPLGEYCYSCNLTAQDGTVLASTQQETPGGWTEAGRALGLDRLHPWDGRYETKPVPVQPPSSSLPDKVIARLERYHCSARTVEELQDWAGDSHGRVHVWEDSCGHVRVHVNRVEAIRLACLDRVWQVTYFADHAELHAAWIEQGRVRRERGQRVHRATCARRRAAVDALIAGEALPYCEGQEGGRVYRLGYWYSARGLARTVQERTGLRLEICGDRCSIGPVAPRRPRRDWGGVRFECHASGCAL